MLLQSRPPLSLMAGEMRLLQIELLADREMACGGSSVRKSPSTRSMQFISFCPEAGPAPEYTNVEGQARGEAEKHEVSVFVQRGHVRVEDLS